MPVCIAFLWAVLVVFLRPALAEPVRSGDWFVDFVENRFLYAATINDAGSVFGQYCFPAEGKCLYLIGLRTRCEAGHDYLALANTDAGAQTFEIYCNGELANGRYQYVFKNFDDIDQLVKQGRRVGFALPMQGDEFKVVRFSLRGASNAITGMRRVAERLVEEGQADAQRRFKPAEEEL